MKKKIPTIGEYLRQVEMRFPRTSSKPQNLIAIFDFYDNWKHFESGVKNCSLDILLDPANFKKRFWLYDSENLFKWLSMLVIAFGFIFLFINWATGLSLLILGGISCFFVGRMVTKGAELFIQELRDKVIDGVGFEGLIDLTINYISGIIAFSSPKGFSQWPQYPSSVFTGQKRIIQIDTPLPFFSQQ
jgi:hypothetical protein